MDINLSPRRYTCIVLDIFESKVLLSESMQNRDIKPAAHHFVLRTRFTDGLNVEPYDLFIT